MKLLFAFSFCFLSIFGYAQTSCPLTAVDFGGTLLPIRDTANNTNTWAILNDATHQPWGVDSIVATHAFVRVYFTNRNYTEVGTVLSGDDESLAGGIAGRYKSTDNYYRPHLYHMGPRAFLDYADIYISKPDNLRFYCRWTGSYWQISTFNSNQVTSPALNISWSSGRVRLSVSDWYQINGTATVTPWASNGDSSLFFIPTMEQYDKNMMDVFFIDVFNGGGAPRKLAGSTPPTGLAFVVDFGAYWAQVDPITENFGQSTNIWFIGAGFKQEE